MASFSLRNLSTAADDNESDSTNRPNQRRPLSSTMAVSRSVSVCVCVSTPRLHSELIKASPGLMDRGHLFASSFHFNKKTTALLFIFFASFSTLLFLSLSLSLSLSLFFVAHLLHCHSDKFHDLRDRCTIAGKFG